MKERPILFSPDMVKAILAGKKTQTRRVMRLQPTSQGVIMRTPGGNFDYIWPEESGKDHYCRCPYGVPGDQLWVRENWKLVNWQWEDPEQKIMYSDGSGRWVNPELRIFEEQPFDNWLMREYERVTKHPTSKETPDDEMDSGFRWEIEEKALPWRPGIFMPHWMSRITLEIVSICAERVQQIPNQDIVAEGIADIGAGDLRGMFANTWNVLNAKRGYPWSANPWVWRIEFKRVEDLTPSPSPTRGEEQAVDQEAGRE